MKKGSGCDLLKIHYLCGNKDNILRNGRADNIVVICSKFITFAVTKTTLLISHLTLPSCDLLKIHYLCGNKDNRHSFAQIFVVVVICSKFITFAVTKTTTVCFKIITFGCDLLKIHYLCGNKDNMVAVMSWPLRVVICSKFITFAVTKTTAHTFQS